jgi:dihydropteroate synthase
MKRARNKRLVFGPRALVMGVLNLTPDSFSDGGQFFGRTAAVRRAIQMADEGADIIDIGGESTRPGAEEIGADEEIRRTIPVIEALSKKISIPISIDTRKAGVARLAIDSGASVINDVSGLSHDKAMASLAAESGAGLILMHMRGLPDNMQKAPCYKNLIKDIITSLKESVGRARRAGVTRNNIIIDPGIGFGKTVEHNLEIINNLDRFKVLGYPICVGVSRKAFIGRILGKNDPADRLVGTVSACSAAIVKGANMIRVHDVKECREAAMVASSILKESVLS